VSASKEILKMVNVMLFNNYNGVETLSQDHPMDVRLGYLYVSCHHVTVRARTHGFGHKDADKDKDIISVRPCILAIETSLFDKIHAKLVERQIRASRCRLLKMDQGPMAAAKVNVVRIDARNGNQIWSKQFISQ